MLALMTLLVMGFVVFSMMREGMFTSFCYLVGVIFAGLVSFHCWPALANTLEDSFKGSLFEHYEDAMALYGVFALVLGLFRVITNFITNRELDLPPQMSQIGGGCIGAVTGYLLAGFLVCAMQTLPWDERFLGYAPPTDAGYISKKVFPPDQVWLKIMKHASLRVFDDEDASYSKAGEPFDDFTFKYSKYRRLQPDGKPLEIPKPAPPPKKDFTEEKKDPSAEEKKDPSFPGKKDPMVEEKKDPNEENKDNPPPPEKDM